MVGIEAVVGIARLVNHCIFETGGSGCLWDR